MGRKTSAVRLDALVSNWAALVRGMARSGRDLKQGHKKLAALCGLDPAELSAAQASQLKTAIRELAAIMRSRPGEAGLGSGADTFEAWIRRRFVVPGPDLLVSDERRRAQLTSLRDQDRRVRQAARGRQGIRIEMRAETWAKLKALKAEFGLPSLGATVQHLVSRQQTETRRAAKGGSSDKCTKPANDLFSDPTRPAD